MKVLFAGPSLFGSSLSPGDLGLVERGPAKQGDVVRAVIEGATTIGIVDGLYGTIAAVWHKEILFALSSGVHVLGAASIGALRAAECASFGMIGVGSIYARYLSGELDDDAAVAQLHAPAEFGYEPLTEALVNVEATILSLERRRRVSAAEAAILRTVASTLHFTERTWKCLIDEAQRAGLKRADEIAELMEAGKVNLKRQDAEHLLGHLVAAPKGLRAPPRFELSRTQMLKETLSDARRFCATH